MNELGKYHEALRNALSAAMIEDAWRRTAQRFGPGPLPEPVAVTGDPQAEVRLVDTLLGRGHIVDWVRESLLLGAIAGALGLLAGTVLALWGDAMGGFFGGVIWLVGVAISFVAAPVAAWRVTTDRAWQLIERGHAAWDNPLPAPSESWIAVPLGIAFFLLACLIAVAL